MSEEQSKRKLAAILSADAKDYSRLMEDDEEATVQTIKAYRELVISQIQNQNGRVVDAKGDNLLAEFSSVVDAVRCAVEIQRELGRRNAELPEHRKMEFRIGVNVGDVIEVREKSRQLVPVQAALEVAEGRGVPNWLDMERNLFKGTVQALPTKEDIDVLVNEQVVVELYSR